MKNKSRVGIKGKCIALCVVVMIVTTGIDVFKNKRVPVDVLSTQIPKDMANDWQKRMMLGLNLGVNTTDSPRMPLSRKNRQLLATGSYVDCVEFDRFQHHQKEIYLIDGVVTMVKPKTNTHIRLGLRSYYNKQGEEYELKFTQLTPINDALGLSLFDKTRLSKTQKVGMPVSIRHEKIAQQKVNSLGPCQWQQNSTLPIEAPFNSMSTDSHSLWAYLNTLKRYF